ncbi:MAG: hypothetical protein V3R83_09695 [Gammaproteobacteria bacterium]
MKIPWHETPLGEWSIVGMNHFFIGDQKHLFVALTKDGASLVETGRDEDSLDSQKIWGNLRRRAIKESDATS